MAKRNVQAQRPIEIGILEDESVCYSIFSYLEGEDAKKLLPTYSSKEQYEIGIEAGKDLAKCIHMKLLRIYFHGMKEQ